MKEWGFVTTPYVVESIQNGFIVTSGGHRYIFKTFSEVVDFMAYGLGCTKIGEKITLVTNESPPAAQPVDQAQRKEEL